MKIKVLLILCVVHTTFVSAVRIKIALSNDEHHATAARLKRQSYCSEVSLVSREMLNSPPYNEIPDEIISSLNSRVRFYYVVAEVVTNIQMRVVEGIGGNVTVAVVLAILKQEGCFPYFYGGVVRDIFLNAANVADVDLEADCNVEDVVDICNRNWGSENCGINNMRTIVHIGQAVNSADDVIDIASTELTFYGENSLLNLEYTVNSLALHKYIIVDLTGHGVDDVCAAKIRIPSDDDSIESWDNWREKSIVRLYRYWKLRTKGFTAISQTTSDYIVNQTKLAINEDNGRGFKSFYCKTIIKAERYDENTDSCAYSNELTEMCTSTKTITRVNDYHTAFREDFGQYWTDTLQYMIPECMSINNNSNGMPYRYMT